MIWPWSRIVPRRSTYELTASERCCTHLTRSTMRNTMSRSIDQHSLTMSTTTLQSQNSSLSPSRSHDGLQAHKASLTLIRQNSQSSVGPQEHADLPAPHSPATGPLGCLGPQEPAPPPRSTEHGACQPQHSWEGPDWWGKQTSRKHVTLIQRLQTDVWDASCEINKSIFSSTHSSNPEHCLTFTGQTAVVFNTRPWCYIVQQNCALLLLQHCRICPVRGTLVHITSTMHIKSLLLSQMLTSKAVLVRTSPARNWTSSHIIRYHKVCLRT